jgi:hypothetical protein
LAEIKASEVIQSGMLLLLMRKSLLVFILRLSRTPIPTTKRKYRTMIA